jgi:hypothetical protein
MTSEAQRMREQAARCLRLANQTLREDVIGRLRALAADYLENAQALEWAADQRQRQIRNVAPPPEPSHGAAQQQRQVQPKKADDTE